MNIINIIHIEKINQGHCVSIACFVHFKEYPISFPKVSTNTTPSANYDKLSNHLIGFTLLKHINGSVDALTFSISNSALRITACDSYSSYRFSCHYRLIKVLDFPVFL